jgi:gliding motility-associated-like protein
MSVIKKIKFIFYFLQRRNKFPFAQNTCRYSRFIISFFFVLSFNTITAQSVGGVAASDTTYCSTTNSGVVTVTGYVGNILNWQSTTDGGNTWNSNLNTTPNQTYFNLNQTTCYRAVVQNGISAPDTSTIVCISIYAASVGGTLAGGGTFCDSTGSGTLTLSGYSGHISFWQASINNGATWTNIPDTTNAENYPSSTISIIYRAVVQSNIGCTADTSTQASFDVSSQAGAGIINGPSSVCVAGNSGVLTLTSYSGTIVKWESSTNNGATWTSIVNNTDTEPYLNLSQTTLYRTIVQSGTCGVDTTFIDTVAISPLSVAGTITGGGDFCGVPATGTLTLNGTTGTIIGWASSINNGTSFTNISNTGSTQTYTNVPVTTAYVAIVQSGSCGADTSAFAMVNVAAQTIAGTVSLSDTVCGGVNEDTLNLSGNLGSVLHWLSSTDSGAVWSTIANTTTSQTYTGLMQTTWYAAVVQSGTCTIDTSVAAHITVSPQPTVNAGSDTTIMQGTAIVLNGSGTGTPLWTPLDGLSSPSVFAPTANPAVTTTYILIVQDNNCVNADTVNITVIQNKFAGKVGNLFTPNGDGLNDTWYIEDIRNFPDNEVAVYNIYGNEVYRTKSYANNWQGTYNGSNLPDGTYYYVIRFDSFNITLRGAVDILRSK